MSTNTENYLKEIQSVVTKSLIENREISELLEKQNEIAERQNMLLEDLLNEIKDLSYELKNS